MAIALFGSFESHRKVLYPALLQDPARDLLRQRISRVREFLGRKMQRGPKAIPEPVKSTHRHSLAETGVSGSRPEGGLRDVVYSIGTADAKGHIPCAFRV